ncbi:hypothetical protein PPSIR1_01217 [Plesiocystis pacifica SIR-1]|uniref:Uncharacterized protein n=1 Tax=Plesiocystis pacifica SIR-1 TaxID=391625 RepID=A6GHW8_9BACT|nr:hypothetical protein PPSIR1_01217 [Plesiocystis pacifica SIR-1]
MRTRSGSRAWSSCSANTRLPATLATPSTRTLPGIVDIDGPRTVRARPETWR